jgi:hypothetical protein
MPVALPTSRIYHGSALSALYRGADKVWEPEPSTFAPSDIAGLTVWLDASTLPVAPVASWPDLSGLGHHGTMVATPLPTVRAAGLNGRNVVRFTVNEGRVRGNTGHLSGPGPAPGYNYSILYVARMVGPFYGRIFAGLYPSTNFLLGYHTSAEDCCYDGTGFILPGHGWTAFPTPWRMWGMTGTHDGTTAVDKVYMDRVHVATGSGGSGFQEGYNLSGYDATGIQETCDAEVAELLIYRRGLTDPERVAIEDYLRAKWALP